MWPPPIEAVGPQYKTNIWGLPALIWGIIIVTIIIILLILATLFICCWLIPNRRKFLSPTRYNTTNTGK